MLDVPGPWRAALPHRRRQVAFFSTDAVNEAADEIIAKANAIDSYDKMAKNDPSETHPPPNDPRFYDFYTELHDGLKSAAINLFVLRAKNLP